MGGPLPTIIAVICTQSRGNGFGEDVRMVTAFDAPAGWSAGRANVKDATNAGNPFDILANSRGNVVRQPDGYRHVATRRGQCLFFKEEIRPSRIDGKIIGRPKAPSRRALFDFNSLARLYVEESADAECQRNVSVKNKAQAIVGLRRLDNEFTKLGQHAAAPIRLVSDVAAVEIRNES